MQRIKPRRMIRWGGMATATVLAAALLTLPTDATVEPASTTAPPGGADRTARHDETGKLGFIGSAPGRPIDTGAARTDSPAAVAREFLGSRGRQFGINGGAAGLRVADQRPAPGGGTVVRLDQSVAGVPVLGGEFTVNLDPARDVLSVLGEASPIEGATTEPSVSADTARDSAVQRVSRETGTPASSLATTQPMLMFYDPRLLDAPSPFQSARLSWVLEVRSRGPVAALRHQVVVDAASGTVALSFSTIAEAKNRVVCDANNTSTQYPCTTPLRTETNPPRPGDDADVRAAFDYAGDTYDFFFSRFGRDSLDGAGLQLKSTVDWCPAGQNCATEPYQNAFWDGSQMVYGDGFASADDVVGHELTHGVTDFTSHLFYYQQSGAINESMSDVFGEFVDLVNGDGTDTAAVRWQVGEDVPGFGALRDMEDPPVFGDPDRMLSTRFFSDPDEGDAGGVHINSGVNNKAAFLIADGGSFNGQTVTGLGITKAARIYHTVNTTMLVSGSDYADLANALRQGCRNLASAGTDGITTADCNQVDTAVLATEMDQNPVTAPTGQATACPTGLTVTSTLMADNLESNTGQLTTTSITGANAWHYPQNPNPFFDATYATSGDTNIWGDNAAAISDSAIRMTAPVAIPTGAYLHFNHAYGFEDDAQGAWDGGVVEYSTAGPGGPWVDAGSLFAGSGGANGYTGTIATSGNPLRGRPAFVRESNGYGASRADLSSLAGQSVLFRWRIGTDSIVGDYGWFLDDLRISTCAAPQVAPPVAPPPAAPAPTTSAPPPLPSPPTDTTAPDTRIKKHPRKTTTLRRAKLTFSASEAGARFQCKLDRGRWRTCTSPRVFKVKPGRHTFRVRAIDTAGNVDATPAKFRWRVRRAG